MTTRARTEGENMYPSIPEHSRRHPSKHLGHEPNVLTAMTRVLFLLTSARPALFWCSNNRIRPFSPTKKPAPAPIFTLLRFWNCYEYFHDLSDLMPFFHVFFYDYIIHLAALPLTTSTPAPAHSEHPSRTQPRHYLYMFTYPRPQ